MHTGLMERLQNAQPVAFGLWSTVRQGSSAEPGFCLLSGEFCAGQSLGILRSHYMIPGIRQTTEEPELPGGGYDSQKNKAGKLQRKQPAYLNLLEGGPDSLQHLN